MNILQSNKGWVFGSPAVQSVKRKLKQECEVNREYRSVSLDGTMKPCFTLLGQPTYLAPRAAKADHAVPVSEQKYTLITGLGLTGAVLIMRTARWEKPTDVEAVLVSECTPSQLLEIEHLAVDNPSRKLFLRIRLHCENFTTLSCCIRH